MELSVPLSRSRHESAVAQLFSLGIVIDFGTFASIYLQSCLSQRETDTLGYDDSNHWQFLCGEFHDDGELPEVVGVGHLLDRDPSLEKLSDLPLGWSAERQDTQSEWRVFRVVTKMMPNKSPEPTAVGACSPLSRVTSRVGGGLAFFVRPHHARSVIHVVFSGVIVWL